MSHSIFTKKQSINEGMTTAMQCECTTLAPATIAPVINANVKQNPNPNPNPNLNPYPTPNQKQKHYPHSKPLLPEISWQEQLSPEQMSDHMQCNTFLGKMHHYSYAFCQLSVIYTHCNYSFSTVVAQWIRPRTLNYEAPILNMLAEAVVPFGKAVYPHCLVPRKGLKTLGPLVACL